MSDSPNPKQPVEVIDWFIWGIAGFIFFMNLCEMINVGNWRGAFIYFALFIATIGTGLRWRRWIKSAITNDHAPTQALPQGSNAFVSMAEAARRTFEAVEHLSEAPRDINPKSVLKYYADLIRISIKAQLYGCAPASRNKTPIPIDRAEHLYILDRDDKDPSKLWKLSDKENPAYTEVCIKEGDLVKAIQAVVELIESLSQ